jgi:BirA family biotin operon repressor/biotin-[acetyl-CoA-carboxylase] ligase
MILDSTQPVLPPPFQAITHDALPSTSDEAKRLASAGAPHGTLVQALSQTAGRGRLNRQWVSPAGNLYMSVILRPRVTAIRGTELGFVASLAVADAISEMAPDPRAVRLKWPNDVLLNDAKLAGILLETELGPDNLLAWVVLGIGINILSTPDDTPYPATCLAEQGTPPSLDSVLAILCTALNQRLDIWERDGFDQIRGDWVMRSRGVGMPIRLKIGTETISGRFHDLDRDGALLLECEGSIRRITAGDVHFAAI